MKTPGHITFCVFGAAVALFTFGACGTVADGDDGTTAVYGGWGPVSPWDYGDPGYVEGGVYVHPPYHGDDHARDEHPAPAGHAAVPSIPHNARPAAASHASGGGRRRP